MKFENLPKKNKTITKDLHFAPLEQFQKKTGVIPSKNNIYAKNEVDSKVNQPHF